MKDFRERAEIAIAEGIRPRPVMTESNSSPARNEPNADLQRRVEQDPDVEDGDSSSIDIAITPRTNPTAVEKRDENVHTEAEIRLMKRFAPQFLPQNEGCIDR